MKKDHGGYFYRLIILTSILIFFSNYMLAKIPKFKKNSNQIKLEQVLLKLKLNKTQNNNARVAFLTKQFINAPYIYSDILSGGNELFQAGTQPLYRLDGFDCQTFVQVIIAFLHSKDVAEFNNTILKLTFKNGKNDFASRNNFPDGDWNPENRKQGFLRDITSTGVLAPYAAYTSADLTRERWTLQKHPKIYNTTTNSSPQYKFEKVWISYLPKTLLLKKTSEGYVPNQELFNKIATPAVVEIVRDVKNWYIGTKNVKDIVGSELNVSHMGILYRQTFRFGELIYQQVYCDFNNQHQKTCIVKPIYCNKKTCNELMLAHATASHPNHFYWYATENNNYVCAYAKPTTIKKFTDCNRVEREPLSAYLIDYQYGWFWYLMDPAFLGIHLEKIV